MKEYIFTFGVGHALEGKCVRIAAETMEEARGKMVEKYGTHWAFGYSAEDWDKMHKEWYGEFLEKEIPF